MRGLKSILYPKTCPACKIRLEETSNELVCRKCHTQIKMNLPPFCVLCGRHLEKKNPNKNICPSCIRKKVHFDRAWSACVYEGVAKKLIHEFKYKGKSNLAKPLSQIMINFIREYSLPLDDLDLIIPIPLHKTKLREREFNQAERLSMYIAEEFKKATLPELLIRTRPTKSQTGLKDKERAKNVRDSFRVNKETLLKNKNLLLIDDVLTTGATSSEASLELKNSGAQAVFVLTLAN
ncbi:MAG: ComF family protein [Candidatus Omnitrophica bacterium]|nr:ComF family protein [Candidatus Omnitrophota bacterium]